MPIGISGLGSDLDTQGIINKLVEIEKIPLKRLHFEKELTKYEKKTWSDLKTKLQKFSETLKKLYGFERIFRKRTIIADKDEFLSSFVIDNTEKGKHTIEIKQLAAATKITSDKIPLDKQLPGSVFTITIGDEKIKVDGFKNGGTINKLTDVLNNDANKLVKAQKINIDNNNVVLSIKSLKTGKKNKLKLDGEKEKDNKLFDELGLFKTIKPVSIKYNFNNKTPSYLSFHDNGYKNTPSLLIVNKKKPTIQINKQIENGELNFVYRSINMVEKKITTDEIKLRSINPITIKDVTIFGSEMIMNKKQMDPILKKGDISIIITDSNGEKKIKNLSSTNKWINIKIDLKDLNDIDTISFKNNTDKHFLIDNLEIFKKDKEKTVFKNVVRKAKDAKLKVDDVNITRDKNNNLDDIIEGVILNLKKLTEEPITIEIKEDMEKIKVELNNFVKEYNEIIKFIKEKGKNSKATKPGDKITDKGILSNDISLMNLHSKLRSTVLNSYITSLGSKLALLAQIGITTGKWGTDWESISKGLLTFNEEEFTTSLNAHGDKISELFGYDTNDDRIIDTGAAFKLYQSIKPFFQKRGIVEGKISLANTMIRSHDKRITKKEGYIESYRKKLRYKFGKMEQGLNRLKGNQQAIQSQLNNLPGKSSGKKEE